MIPFPLIPVDDIVVLSVREFLQRMHVAVVVAVAVAVLPTWDVFEIALLNKLLWGPDKMACIVQRCLTFHSSSCGSVLPYPAQ